MIEISSSLYENEIHTINSTFDEDSKNIIFLPKEAPIVGEG